MSIKYTTRHGRLTREGVERIHDLLDAGWSPDAIAQEIGISGGTVYSVRTGRSWGMVLVERMRKRERGVEHVR